MNVLAALVLGLFIGWLAEWVVDWAYWRNRIRPVAEENAHLKDQIKILEAKKNKRSSDRTKNIPTKKGKDNLQAIKGIGPVFSQRLNEAGITITIPISSPVGTNTPPHSTTYYPYTSPLPDSNSC